MLNPRETEKERIQVPLDIAEINQYDKVRDTGNTFKNLFLKHFTTEGNGLKMETKIYSKEASRQISEGYKSIKEVAFSPTRFLLICLLLKNIP